MGYPTTLLLGDFEGLSIRETDHFIIPFLVDEFTKINSSSIYTDRCTRLQSLDLKTDFFELFTDAMTGHLTHTTSLEMLFANMYQTV